MPALPRGPLPQVPMDQIPSTPPQVSYQGGMLTIVAQNSSLGDILREVHKHTGATIEVPSNATEPAESRLPDSPPVERSVTHAPGRAEEPNVPHR